jgi:hypothetical protein
MGKLAERLADARRSGVYRVETTDALEEAAALNGFMLTHVVLENVCGSALSRTAMRALPAQVDGHVLLLSGFEALVADAPGAFDSLVLELDAAAARCREGERRFFAAFVDPSALLPLAPLYNRRRSAPERRGDLSEIPIRHPD